jgi:hypothetical protein
VEIGARKAGLRYLDAFPDREYMALVDPIGPTFPMIPTICRGSVWNPALCGLLDFVRSRSKNLA